jgi:hypothetical protein
VVDEALADIIDLRDRSRARLHSRGVVPA